ncbi:MAG TPA: mechanosensitive ion channel domain-containing protein, partial [Chitinophagaceae bacterium]|nr:mechanosensitive ion channel domain-containing protein [Chitinophagaceae bacterium]
IEWASLYENLKINMDIYNRNILRPDEKPLLASSPSDYKKNIFQVASISKQAGSKVLWYYLESRQVAVVLITLLCYCCAAWIVFIRRQYRKSLRAYVKTEDIRLNYLASHPLLASLLISFNFAPFFFPHPPVIFVEIVWTLLGLVVTVLFLSDPRITVKAKTLWIIFFILFRLVALDNLLLYKSYEERWLMLVLNSCFITIDIIAYRINKRTPIFTLKKAVALIILSITLHSASIICNLAGLFNLSKTLTIAATFSGFTVIVLRLFLDAAKEALTFQLAFMRRNFSDENVFTRLYKIVRRLLIFFAVVTWIVVFLSALNIFDRVQESVVTFLKRPIGVGESSFTIWNILLFIFVIWAAVMLSNLVSLITEIRTKQDKKYFNLRNAKLFLKIAIITTGVLLAFVTTRIPIDRIAIILGALSVGIGFGLQNLVSNLIAGVMISLEHPVRIGDTIEVGGHIGVIKEIGIRSIHVRTDNGSDVIIPNGDLLSQHVVNWTLSGNQRRIELLVPVKSGVDFDKAKEIIKTVLRDHENIMKKPSPEVILNNFSKSRDGGFDTIDIDCYFWCEDQRDAARVRSRVLEDIHRHLEGIYPENVNMKKNNPGTGE